MALINSGLILALAAFLQTTAGSTLRDGEFCENLSIIGGEYVTIEKVPFMAALYEQEEFRCGASIVNKNFVLTAASCIGSDEATRKVLVGTDRLNNNGYLIEVVKTICHEDYNKPPHANDICLLKLKFEVPFGRNVGVIALPAQDYPIGLFNVTGWGLTENSATAVTGTSLRQTTVPFVSEECCTRMYNGKIVLQDTQICAGSYGHDSCLGDSGGPLTNNGLQVGIASYGEGCGGKPGVYTKVASFRNWIDDAIAHNQ